MYNVLIADDEQLMRNYLLESIKELCPFFRVTGIAEDGTAAMLLLKKQRFDLVITDIKMPEIDGLSLSKFLSETSPGTKIIIVSGYDEFEYAQKAIQYQVSEYLLKPINDEQLRDALYHIRETLDKEKRSKNTPEQYTYSHLPLDEIKNSLFSALLYEEEKKIYELYQELQRRKTDLAENCHAVVLFTVDEWKQLLLKTTIAMFTTAHMKLNQCCQSYADEHGICTMFQENGSTVMLLTENSQEALKDQVFAIYETIKQDSVDYDVSGVICTCGIFVKDIMELSESWKTAKDTLVWTLKDFKSPLFSDCTQVQKAFIAEVHEVCNTIYENYVSFSFDRISSDLKFYCDLFKEEISVAAVLRYGAYLIRYISERSHIKSSYIKTAFHVLLEQTDILIKTGTLHIDEIQNILLKMIKALHSGKQIKLVPETTQIVETAKQYMITNYNKQISLTMMAEEIGVNASYLSDLIHKNLGLPYSKYLLRIRMEQAARIMRHNPNEKIYQIAEKTGFVSTKHFISVFKKHYGLTPTKYIQNMEE